MNGKIFRSLTLEAFSQNKTLEAEVLNSGSIGAVIYGGFVNFLMRITILSYPITSQHVDIYNINRYGS